MALVVLLVIRFVHLELELSPGVRNVYVMFNNCELSWLEMSKQGGVGLKIRVYDRIMCFVNCHLAAHLEAVNRRNADFDHIYRNMAFNRSSNFLNNASGMVPHLFLSFSLALSTYLSWLLYSSGFHWILSVAAGVSTTAQMIRGPNVLNATLLITTIITHLFIHLYWLTIKGLSFWSFRLWVATLKKQGLN